MGRRLKAVRYLKARDLCYDQWVDMRFLPQSAKTQIKD
jgi:hypothetical protein